MKKRRYIVISGVIILIIAALVFNYKNHYTTFCVIVLIFIILLLLGMIWLLKNVTYNIYHLIKDIRTKKKENVINRLDNIKPYAIYT